MTAADWNYRLRTGDGLKAGWAGVMQIVCGLMASGEDELDIQPKLMDPTMEGVRYLNFSSNGQPRPIATRQRLVRNSIQKARRHIEVSTRLTDRGAAVEELARSKAIVDNDPQRWKGRGGATDRAVVLGAIQIAMAKGNTRFNASVHQLADAANVGVKGAFKATERLRDWLELVELGRGTRASTWQLRVRDGNPLCPRKDSSEGFHGARFDSDVFRWEGLGKSLERVYALLGDSPLSASELAMLLEVTAGTIRRHLRTLESHGLAVRLLDGWCRGTADLEDVAVTLGVDNRGYQQRLQHRTRAKLRKEYLKSRARASRQRKDDASVRLVPQVLADGALEDWKKRLAGEGERVIEADSLEDVLGITATTGEGAA